MYGRRVLIARIGSFSRGAPWIKARFAGTITWEGPMGKTLIHKPEPLTPPAADKPPY